MSLRCRPICHDLFRIFVSPTGVPDNPIPTSVSAADNVVTGRVHPYVPTSCEAPVNLAKDPLLRPSIHLADRRHKIAADRLEADKYFIPCCEYVHGFSNDSLSLCADESECEFLEGYQPVIVKGQLRSHNTFWQEIGASQFIIDTISRGYIIPFVSTPPRAFSKNNKSALQHSDFANCAIDELIANRCVVQCSSPPAVVNPLSVAVQSSGKKRLILDLPYPNSCILKSKITFEGAQAMLTLLSDCTQNWLFSFDIKSGYHHIDIFPDDQQFLGFSWLRNGVVEYFQFTVLPFGLATGPYIFTKVMRP